MDINNQERYYEGMLRMMREEDAKVAQENVMHKAERSIWVTFSQKEGVYKFGADKDPKLATGDWDDVSFPGIPHFPYFNVRIPIFPMIQTLSLSQPNAGCKGFMTLKAY